jgi:hypothetical protein
MLINLRGRRLSVQSLLTVQTQVFSLHTFSPGIDVVSMLQGNRGWTVSVI